jgi:hypothetical protein
MIVKKIKEIKEDEETSLFEEIKFKSQAAMEYLMTYGWAMGKDFITFRVLSQTSKSTTQL